MLLSQADNKTNIFYKLKKKKKKKTPDFSLPYLDSI